MYIYVHITIHVHIPERQNCLCIRVFFWGERSLGEGKARTSCTMHAAQQNTRILLAPMATQVHCEEKYTNLGFEEPCIHVVIWPRLAPDPPVSHWDLFGPFLQKMSPVFGGFPRFARCLHGLKTFRHVVSVWFRSAAIPFLFLANPKR